MQRIYLPKIPGPHYTISARTDADLYHQITRVLRMTIGESIAFFENGRGDVIYTIAAITRDWVELDLAQESPVILDISPRIRLYQALPNKLDKIEYILQKGCEVGVSEFIFFASERSNTPHGLERKIERLHEIAREATEQSGGVTLPTISFVQGVPSDLKGAIIAHTEDHGASLSETVNQEVYTIIIGPEGGWSPAEIVSMKSLGARSVKCGERILRTETAGVVMAFYLRNR
jgi:16S rRNA (uracil1498-N3)-methyltransferase